MEKDQDMPEKKGCILAVDDDENVRASLRSQLARAGYEVQEAASGEEALRLAPVLQPDIIFLDMNMSGIDGVETCRRLRQDPAMNVVYIIMLTGVDVEAESLGNGADDYIKKPYKPGTLLARLESGLRTVAHNRKILSREEAAYLELVGRLVTAAEFRDPETAMHIMRMSHYSRIIAEEIGLSERQSDLILRAAPMHDIGKISTPDEILLAPRKLDAQEFEIMKLHAVHGYDILKDSPSPLVQMGAEIAHTHHEKWDGSGYPRGLRGDDIPLVGRIVAVADVFDALTSQRPYKKAWDVDAAFDFLREQSGAHFEPRLVEAFLHNQSEVLRIKAQHSDED